MRKAFKLFPVMDSGNYIHPVNIIVCFRAENGDEIDPIAKFANL
jgi:hypothetical protein